MEDTTRQGILKRLNYIEGHLHTCVASGIRDGREDAVISELMELYEIANR